MINRQHGRITRKQICEGFLFAIIIIASVCLKVEAQQVVNADIIKVKGDDNAITKRDYDALNTRKSVIKSEIMDSLYIVQLQSPSILNAAHSALLNSNAKQPAVTASEKAILEKRIQSEQSTFMTEAKRRFGHLTHLSQYDTVVNALAIVATPSQIKRMQQMAEVKRIYPVRRNYLNLDASHNVIKSAQAWQKLDGQDSAGEGIKIAIIDTGIRTENPLFHDEGIPPIDLSDNQYLLENPDYCRSSPSFALFCNNKIIVARWIDPAEHMLAIYDGEYQSPYDFNGHGSHVAGIASGRPISVDVDATNVHVSGVAPSSYLMIYKALYVDPFGQTIGTDTMLLDALEHAVKDGANVINNSWGSLGQDPQNSIFYEALTNAENAGIVVVNAAGNDTHAGRGQTINCPACIEAGLAVANTTHGRFFGNAMRIQGQTFYGYQGTTPSLFNDISSPLRFIENTLDGLADACAQLLPENEFDGDILLMEYRYDCDFNTIAENINRAGGSMAILMPSPMFSYGTYEPLLPWINENSPIPVLGVSRDTGNQLLELAHSNTNTLAVSAITTPNVEPQYVDKLNPFSSTGPNLAQYILKPDVSAPGTNILSAYSPDVFTPSGLPFGVGNAPASQESNNTGTFALLTGTSMASPHVAGAAALVKQAHPDWSAKQIKSALTSTSEDVVENGTDPATPFQMGAGRLNIAQAIDSVLTFTQVSFNDNACIHRCSFTNRIKNMLDHDVVALASVEFTDNSVTATLSQNVFSLSSADDTNSNQDVSLTVDVSAAEIGSWIFGQLLFHVEDTVQRLPIAVKVVGSSDNGVLSIVDKGENGNEHAFQTQLRNIGLVDSNNITLTTTFAENAVLVPNSESANVNAGSTTTLTYDAAANALTWTGQLNEGNMALTPVTPWGNSTLKSYGVSPIPCAEGCSYFNTYVAFDFRFNGNSYNTISVSDNGFAMPGNNDFSFWAALFNQAFPNQVNPNSIIAPLWTEFDLKDPSLPTDDDSGELRIAVRVIDNINYLVIEWLDVQQNNDEFDPLVGQHAYSFQLIIQENTDNIWFNYLSVPELPPYASIGAENYDGRIGISLYFDGEGIGLPTPISGEGYTLKLTYTPEGKVELDYQLALGNEQDFTRPDVFEVNEDSSASVNLITNDTHTTNLTVEAEGLDDSQTIMAFHNKALPIVGEIDAHSLSIVDMPSYGDVSVAPGGLIEYTPQSDFVGHDEFSYKVADEGGHFSQPTLVNVQVNNVNDTPVINHISASDVVEGEQVNISVAASDIDGDTLTYVWTQVAGPVIPFEQTDNLLSFTAPQVTRDTALLFSLLVSDGTAETTSEPIHIKVANIKTKSGGGSFFFLELFMLICAGYTLRKVMR